VALVELLPAVAFFPLAGAAVEGLAPEGTAAEGLAPEGTAAEGLAPEGATVEGLAPDGATVEALATLVFLGLPPEGLAADGLAPDTAAVEFEVFFVCPNPSRSFDTLLFTLSEEKTKLLELN
jgi:hypothetical protein